MLIGSALLIYISAGFLMSGSELYKLRASGASPSHFIHLLAACVPLVFHNTGKEEVDREADRGRDRQANVNKEAEMMCIIL